MTIKVGDLVVWTPATREILRRKHGTGPFVVIGCIPCMFHKDGKKINDCCIFLQQEEKYKYFFPNLFGGFSATWLKKWRSD